MNKTILLLGLGTLVFFGLGGILIIEYVQGQKFMDLLGRGMVMHHQLALGILAGMGGSAIALFLISRPFFKKERIFYSDLISRLELDRFGMVFLSICAGIGEEIFFRAGIQPLLGIWWTALIFVGLHGYLNPGNVRISVYGIILVGVIAIFGYLFEFAGIFSAITAHALFDVVLFWKMNKYKIKE